MITFFVITTIALLIAYFAYRKIKLEQNLNDSWWKVSFDDIVFPKQNKSGIKSSMSIISDTDGCISGKASSLRVGSIGHSLVSAAGELDTVQVGVYKGVKIAYKQLQIKKLVINRSLLMEIKQVKNKISFKEIY